MRLGVTHDAIPAHRERRDSLAVLDGVRPYLIVSNQNRPFYGDRYTVAVITSTDRQRAVELTAASLTEGQLKTYPSYVSPWSLHVFPDQEILKRVAQVDDETMRTVAEGIHELTRVL